MNATQKFYAVFFLALALVVGISFAAGYRVGYAAGGRALSLHRPSNTSRAAP